MSTVLEKIEKSKDSIEAEKLINEFFPGWLVYSVYEYSPDYPHLQSNWRKICELTRSIPQKIVFVSHIDFEDENKSKLCNLMTKNGYCIRRVGEFTPCPACARAIPCEEIWHLLKEKGFPVPETWSEKCRNCQPKD